MPRRISPIWDTHSPQPRWRKARPSSDTQNGMHFPYGGPSGKRVPESGLGTGRAFRLSPSAETASRNKRSNWDALSKRRPAENTSHSEARFRDAVSACGPVGKVHPVPRHDSGTQFPHAEALQTKAPTRDGAGAKGAAYVVDAQHEQPVSNGRPRPTLPAVTGAAVRGIHHRQIWT